MLIWPLEEKKGGRNSQQHAETLVTWLYGFGNWWV